MITLTIDGLLVTVTEDATILEAAQEAKIKIPTICYHPACTSNGLCRLCVVEVEGSRTLVASCVAKATQGMKVATQSDRIRQARRTILEMLSASIDLREAPEILAFMEEYGASADRFPEANKRNPDIIDDNPMYIRDYARCILCWRCVQVCADDAQYTNAINFSRRGFNTQIATYFEKPLPETACVFCGQCVGVCPTGALKPKRLWLMEKGSSPDEIMSLTRKYRQRRLRNTGSQEHLKEKP